MVVVVQAVIIDITQDDEFIGVCKDKVDYLSLVSEVDVLWSREF